MRRLYKQKGGGGGKHALGLPSLGERFPLVVLNVKVRPFGNLVPGHLPAEPHSEDVAQEIVNKWRVLTWGTIGPTRMNERWKERTGGIEERMKAGGVYIGAHAILACFIHALPTVCCSHSSYGETHSTGV